MSNSPLNLFIIGPSGSGKSTQAKKIAQRYNLTHLSMGQLFRQQINSKSKIGLQAQKYINQGLWVPTPLTLDLLQTYLKNINHQNFIVDGFPRLPDQPAKIKQYLTLHQQSITALIHLSVTTQEITTRRLKHSKLGQKFQHSSRTDNTPAAIASRQQQYQKNINPILDFFKKENKLIDVNGNRPVKPIFDDICQQIDKLLIK